MLPEEERYGFPSRIYLIKSWKHNNFPSSPKLCLIIGQFTFYPCNYLLLLVTATSHRTLCYIIVKYNIVYCILQYSLLHSLFTIVCQLDRLLTGWASPRWSVARPTHTVYSACLGMCKSGLNYNIYVNM